MNSLQSALTSVAQFVPKAIAFLVILLIGWIVAKVLRKVISKLLARVGLDRVAQRGGIDRYLGNNTMSGLTGTLVYAAILLMTLQVAFNVFGPNPVSVLLSDLVAWLPQLFIAAVLIVVAFAVANMVFNLVSGSMAGTSYGQTIARAIQAMIIAVAGIAALNQIGIADTVTTPLLVAALAMIAGVVIVGVGGGLITPMRSRWERMLGAAESEAGNLRAQRANGSQSGSEFGQQAYTSQQYSQPGADTQEHTQQQYQQAPGGQQYYTPPAEPQPPQGT